MRQRALFPVLVLPFLLLLLSSGAGATLNKSIRIDDGERVTRSLSSVNGGITIGRGAEVTGSATTVNGGVRVDDEARTRDLSSVNGSVRIGENVAVDGDVETVNGPIEIAAGTVVSGNAETVNGSIELDGATVEGHLGTVNGEIRLDRGSRVVGDLIIGDTRGNDGWNRDRVLEIVLAGESVIEGDVDVRDDDRRVRVVLRDGSAVRGQVRGAEVVRK